MHWHASIEKQGAVGVSQIVETEGWEAELGCDTAKILGRIPAVARLGEINVLVADRISREHQGIRRQLDQREVDGGPIWDASQDAEIGFPVPDEHGHCAGV